MSIVSRAILAVAGLAMLSACAAMGLSQPAPATQARNVYAAIGAYDVALAAADTYLCRSTAAEAPCDPRPVCKRARQVDCVSKSVADALRKAEADTDPAYEAAKAAVADGDLDAAEAETIGGAISVLTSAAKQITTAIATTAAKAKA